VSILVGSSTAPRFIYTDPNCDVNARLPNVKLAEAVHLSPSPCLARVRELEAGGYISRYVTLLDPLKVGLTVSVFIQVTLEKQVEKQLAGFETAIQKRPR
jgi:DNA-binding Lrp family transcriptional regulator